MKKNAFFYCLFFLYIKCEEIQNIIYNHINEDNNLYFIFTTFGHGERGIYNKVDFFGNNIHFPQTLTKYGSIQHLEIGRNYRKRYSNFLNLNFDKDEIYIRTSNLERTIVSTEKELEGLFNKSIERNKFNIINNGANFWNLYYLSPEEQKEMNKYEHFCKEKLDIDYRQYFNTEIFPILNNCYGTPRTLSLHGFCESVFTSNFEYAYNRDKNNKIGKCGNENVKKIHNFCYDWFNTFRGWNEYAGYMFYMLFQHIFDNMNKAINNSNNLKMMMIGGHDITVDKFMDFLDGLKIIPRTHYPHYAYNIVIELRKYNNDFYLEFYYNDILKYNNTFQNFKNILNTSKYSNLYNYCGIPPWKIPFPNETETIEIKEEIVRNENFKNDTKNIIQNKIKTEKKNENQTEIIQNENLKKEIKQNEIIIKIEKQVRKLENNQTEINKEIQGYKKEINEEYNTTNNQTNNVNINSEKIYLKNNKTNTTLFNIKMKLRKFFKQDDDLNLYIILGSIVLTILIIIITVILIIYILKKRKKQFMKLIEEFKIKNNNTSIVSASDTK